MKKIKFLAMLIMAVVTCASFSACSDDDDNGGGGLTGYWTILDGLEELAREAIENDWVDDDGYIGGAIGYNFINGNTVERGMYSGYVGSRSNSHFQKRIAGKNVSFCFENSRTYTYAREGNKIYITNGDILTVSGSVLLKDGSSDKFVKVK